jgi:glycosyltransferase involved in cell wall biosynthesis
MRRMQLGACDTPNGIATQSRKPNVGIMTHPYFERAGKTPLDNLIVLVKPLANKLFVITGRDYNTPPCDVEVIAIKAKRRTSFVSRTLEQALVHAKVLRLLLKLRGEIDILIFFLGATFPVPVIFAKALGMQTFVIPAAVRYPPQLPSIKEQKRHWQLGDDLIIRLTDALERISYYFSDKLIVYSPSIIDQAKLRRYRKKIVVTHRHFPNLDLYRFKNDVEQRDNVVGYVGRLTEEKGALNFVQAIPRVSRTRDDVSFLIIGEGSCEDEIHAYVERHALGSKVSLTGWIPHEELPDYLASLKLLVIPSMYEGLPNIMVEAMACGSPVLSTPVGSVADVLEDGENGFLLPDNSPACLAEAILKVLAHPNLKRIAVNARALVEREFQYEKLVATWQNIICDTKGDASDPNVSDRIQC